MKFSNQRILLKNWVENQGAVPAMKIRVKSLVEVVMALPAIFLGVIVLGIYLIPAYKNKI